MLETVQETIATYQMLVPGEAALVALSGGADSTALLRALLALDYPVRAYHLNHCLRGEEADRDEAFCRTLCDRLSVPFTAERIDAASYAARIGESIETAARRLRYERLTAVADGAKIATAHTADDNVETMLFHLARGTGPKGLAGIPPVRGQIVRPLIDVARREIERWLAELGQDFVTDSTNGERAFTRNRIRKDVTPVLRALNPSLTAAAARLSRLLRQDEEYLAEQAAALLASAKRGEDSWQVQTLTDAPAALRSRALRALAAQAGMPMRDFSALHVEELSQLLESKNPSAELSLPNGFTARREYGLLRVTPRPASTSSADCPPMAVTVPFNASLWGGHTRLSLRFLKKGEEIYKSFNTFYADCGTIQVDTLHVRTRRSGDRIRLTATGGSRTLKKRMIDQKIPRTRRDQLAVLADANGLIAVQDVGVDIARAPRGGAIIQIQFEG